MTTPHTRWILAALALAASSAARAQDVRVTVVAIAASDRTTIVNPKLAEIAREVKKHDPSLTGFRIANTESQEFTVGQKQSFKKLVDDDASADITVTAKNDTKHRVRLAVKPPSVGEIVYETGYDKFFPIVTRYTAKTGERLIVAIMVKPVTKEPAAAKDGK
ncbi:MAG: hypothetical protein U0746_20400 [Gemmataceae bacterium]